MAREEHKTQMRELRARKKQLGLVEFRADVLPHERKYLEQIMTGIKLQRRLNGMSEELWK